LTADFPFARSLVVVRSNRTVKKTGQASTESRYYLSSLPPQDYTDAQWLALIREHWGGVEIRNHWRRDALMGEDRSRSRNPNLLANMALLRSALLTVLADHFDGRSWPQIREQLNAHPSQSLNLLCP
jgi:predicted transposase YbfD/YdcC